ncbi:unnamed protein product, partial [Polarella glacialis]
VAQRLEQEGHFSRLPSRFEAGYLGVSSSGAKVALLEALGAKSPLREELAAQDRSVGEHLRLLRPHLQDAFGFDLYSRTKLMLQLSFSPSEEKTQFLPPPASSQEADAFLALMGRKRLCLLRFLGPSSGRLRLVPKVADSAEVTLTAVPNMQVLFLTEQYDYSYEPQGESLTLQSFLLEEPLEFEFETAGGSLSVIGEGPLPGPAPPAGPQVVVRGMASRDPCSADNHEQLWTVFRHAGCDGFLEIPSTRFDLDLYVDFDDQQRAVASGKSYCRHQGHCEGVDIFDAAFFNIPEKEVRSIAVTALSVAYFSCVGLALRVGIAMLVRNLDAGLTTTSAIVPPGLPADPHPCRMSSTAAGYFLQNVLGCVLMAIIARHKASMNEHLAVGLSSGLCGSLTTWATWMGEEAATFMNGSIYEAFVSLFAVLCICVASFGFGHFVAGCGMGDEPRCFDEHCGLRSLTERLSRRIFRGAPEATESEGDESSTDGERMEMEERELEEEAEYVDAMAWEIHVDNPSRPSIPGHTKSLPKMVILSDAVHVVIFACGLVVIVVFLGLCAHFQYYIGLFDIAFAPAGALLRWWLSLFNKYTAPFPVFTLVANTLACVCNGFSAIMVKRMGEGLARDAVSAVSTGFAGSLSTVSTLIAELRSEHLGGIRLRMFYFLTSFGLAMAVLLPIHTMPC